MEDVRRPNPVPCIGKDVRNKFFEDLSIKIDDFDCKLNLACGTDYLENWTNLDGCPDIRADVYCNLDSADVKLPFLEDQFDFVYASHVFEHIQFLPHLKKELCRVMRPNGILFVIVPHHQSVDAWGDDTHCRAFSIASFFHEFWPGFTNVHYREYSIEAEQKLPQARTWCVASMRKVKGGES